MVEGIPSERYLFKVNKAGFFQLWADLEVKGKL
jgi:hypothetical protein